MKNLKIEFPLVNGSLYSLEYDSGKELIHNLVTDDWSPPPRSMVIEAQSEDGKIITITIPYDDSDEVFVKIEEA